MAGLFDTFTISKRGLAVQQNNINVNAHNIANVETPGYSRQRATTETTRPFGATSKYHIGSVGQVGTGAEVVNIIRIRDKFIDYQLREEYGKLGNYQVQSDFLSQVEDIFGEPSENGIQNLFTEFYNAFQDVANSPEKSSTKTVAIQAADALARALNASYASLEKKVTNAQELLQQNVVDINSYLDQINDLNKEIKFVSAVGQTPNDLMDKRDYLIDQLSSKFGINVKEESKNTINLTFSDFTTLSDINAGALDKLVDSNPNNKYTRFSYVKSAKVEGLNATTNKYELTVEYYPLGDTTKEPQKLKVEADTEEDLSKLKESLEQNRVLLADEKGNALIYDSGNTKFTATTDGDSITDVAKLNKAILQTYKYDADTNTVSNINVKGEIAGNQSVQTMVKGYMEELDKIAKVLAYSVNAIQTGKTGDATIDGANVTGTTSTSDYPLFVVYGSDAGTAVGNDDNITAKNICVNSKITADTLNCKAETTSGDKNSERAQAIADLLTIKFDVSNIDLDSLNSRADFFNTSNGSGATFDGTKITGSSSGKALNYYYKDMISELGTKTQEANRVVTKQEENTIANLEDQKASVSGVSLDEEMTDLIQFQHAYQANAKMINTIDQLLDVVINQLKA